jgi:hypothetical protein
MWISLYPTLGWVSIVAGSVLLLMLLYKLVHPLRVIPRWPAAPRTEISWRTLGIAAGVVALLLGMLGLTSLLSDRQLQAQALSLSTDIMAFADQRDREMPREGKPNWDEYTRRASRFFDENLNLYVERYAARVASAREELQRRGLSDEELDKYYQRPKTQIAMRTVASRLTFLANQLR